MPTICMLEECLIHTLRLNFYSHLELVRHLLLGGAQSELKEAETKLKYLGRSGTNRRAYIGLHDVTCPSQNGNIDKHRA